MCWFFRKRKEKKKALQEEQLKMQQESMKKESIQKEKPAPQPVEHKNEAPVQNVERKKEDNESASTSNSKRSETKEKIIKNPKYHVSQNKDENSVAFKQWRVRKEGSNKTIKYFGTQAEAILYAEDLANKNGSSVVIHKVDGSIRKQDYQKKT